MWRERQKEMDILLASLKARRGTRKPHRSRQTPHGEEKGWLVGYEYPVICPRWRIHEVEVNDFEAEQRYWIKPKPEYGTELPEKRITMVKFEGGICRSTTT
jgi:hypothetical protein